MVTGKTLNGDVQTNLNLKKPEKRESSNTRNYTHIYDEKMRN